MTDKMDELTKKQQILLEQYNETLKDVKKLLENQEVKDYIEKTNYLAQLRPEIENIMFSIKKEQMEHCNHIWITSEIIREWDGHRTDKTELCTCIKCGLDTHAVYRMIKNPMLTTKLDQNMYSILNGRYYSYKGINTSIICSPELAKGIYEGIKRKNPNITDEQAILYLKQALHKIRTRRVSEEVQKKRIKRLGLSPKFMKWQKNDVIN